MSQLARTQEQLQPPPQPQLVQARGGVAVTGGVPGSALAGKAPVGAAGGRRDSPGFPSASAPAVMATPEAALLPGLATQGDGQPPAAKRQRQEAPASCQPLGAPLLSPVGRTPTPAGAAAATAPAEVVGQAQSPHRHAAAPAPPSLAATPIKKGVLPAAPAAPHPAGTPHAATPVPAPHAHPVHPPSTAPGSRTCVPPSRSLPRTPLDTPGTSAPTSRRRSRTQESECVDLTQEEDSE